MNWCGLDSSCWQLWANIATAVSPIITVIGLGAILFTLYATRHQLDEMSKARFIAAFFEIYKLVEMDDGWKLRRFIYQL